MSPCGCVLALALLAAGGNVLDFSTDPVGKLPAAWTAAQTGEGEGSRWQIVADDAAPGGKALAQVADTAPKPMFNLCIAEKARYREVDLSISFRAIAGKIDQGGGPVWRYRDADNYYIARMNPLEDNFRVYKVEGGKRTQLATVDVKVAARPLPCDPGGPSGQAHPVLSGRHAPAGRRGRHVCRGRRDRPLDQVRRPDPLCRRQDRGAIVRAAKCRGVSRLAASMPADFQRVDGGGIEPPTHGFSVRCSTN